jgi:hypothetical protein
MTTVGYGNQAPSSPGGRALVFTLGFLSILLFGTVLATTGTVISLVVEDFLKRTHLKFLASKVVMIVVWCTFYCIWLIWIAYYYQEWSSIRLDTETELGDNFWFAYITTTTVGLGDYYPTPEVLFLNDLLGFSLIFLFGFVLLSAFLAELTQFLAHFFPDMGHELGKRLMYVGVTGIHFLDSIFSREDEDEDS